jgi:hypothetical protein
LQELALSLAITAVTDIGDLCNLLAVSKGLQAAIVSGSGCRRPAILYDHCVHTLAKTVGFACWLQTYHALVWELTLRYDSSTTEGTGVNAHELEAAMCLGLRPPLKLRSLGLDHPRPLKLLRQVDPQQLEKLTLFGGFSEALAAEFGRFRGLQSLSLDLSLDTRAADCGSVDLSRLSQLTTLTDLEVTCNLKLAGAQHIPSQLQRLHCEVMDDSALNNMHHLVQLRHLGIACPNMTAGVLAAALGAMPQLSSMYFMADREHTVAEQQLQALRAAPALQQLRVGMLPCFTAQEAAHIAQASSLTRLDLQVWPEQPIAVDLSALSTLKQLRRFALRCHNATCGAVTTFGPTLAQLTLLRDLTLGIPLQQEALSQVHSSAV